MPKEKPIVYILRGDDRQAIEAQIRTFYNSLGSPDMAAMNTSRLDGKTTSISELQAAAMALPFLAERRLVVVEDALQPYARGGQATSQARTPEKRDKFIDLLDSLPQTTALVLVIPDERKSRKRGGMWQTYWRTLNENHWLIKWANQAGKRAYIIDCALPSEREMPGWIINKAKEMDGNINAAGAQLLAQYVGNNTQRAEQELLKLLTYVNFDEPVNEDDVETLCFNEMQASIFDMVDALGNRDGKAALHLFHLLLEEGDFFYQIFPMVVRQIRLLIQAREILDLGGTVQDLVKTLGVPAFVAGKIHTQAQKFDLPTLEALHHHLLEIDLGEKTGSMPGEVAMDVLIGRLAGGAFE